MGSVTHAKTVSIADWTQAELDAAIAAGNFPPGTTLANIQLPSDWNDEHDFSLAVADITGLQTALDAKEDAPTGSTWGDRSITVFFPVSSLIATNQEATNYGRVRSTTSKTTGKWYFRVRCVDGLGSGNFDVGLGVCSPGLNVQVTGAAPASGTTNWEWYNTLDPVSDPSPGNTINAPDNTWITIIGDSDAGKLWVKDADGLTSGNPSTGSSPAGTFTAGTRLYAFASMYAEVGATTTVEIDFSTTDADPDLSGFSPWDS